MRLGGGTGIFGQDEAMYRLELAHAVSEARTERVVTSFKVRILLLRLLCGRSLGLLCRDRCGLRLPVGRYEGLVVVCREAVSRPAAKSHEGKSERSVGDDSKLEGRHVETSPS